MDNRHATVSDLDRIMEIVADAQRFLKENGVDQWQDGYPTREVFMQDIEKDCCHVFLVEGRIAGVISVLFEKEHSYSIVEDGKWLTDGEPYAVFHRSAVGTEYHKKGIANEMLSFAENLAFASGVKSMRVDTHRDNKTMRGLLEKRGYIHCGTIYTNGIKAVRNKRVCYEKLL